MNMHRPVGRLGLRSLALFGLLVVSVVGNAADPPERPVYRLGLGDLLDVWVAGHPELSVASPPGIEVGLDGRIRYPYVGGLVVEGLTCEQVEQRLVAGLVDGRVLIAPQILVRVAQSRSQQINVLGAVKSPGPFPYRPGLSIADAAALAGGLQLTADLATPAVSARVVHRDGHADTVSAAALLSGGAVPAGPEIRAGDTILFEVEAEIAVLGAVGSPHTVPAREGLRLSELLSGVGGVSAEGDLQRIIVSHKDGTVQEVDLERKVAQGQGDDPVVHPGDIVYVPLTTRQAIIFGFVADPGRYALREGDRVSDLVAMAKGAQTGASAGDLGAVVLARRDGSARTLNLLGKDGHAPTVADNPVLLPGDQVTVPQLRNRVVVNGYVKQPGSYDFQPGDRASDAIAKASGPARNGSSPTTVRIRARDGAERAVNLAQDNPALQPDDEIIVPFVRYQVTVVGYIGRPGMYDCHEGDTVLDMLALAGGGTRAERTTNYIAVGSNLGRVVLYRPDDGPESLRELDVQRFLTKGDRTMNPEVKPGDVIYVQGKRQLDLGQILRDLLIIPRLLDQF